MTPGQPDVVEQLPATGNPMEPQSGTYGAVANLDRLKQDLALPAGGAATAPTAPPAPGEPHGQPMQMPQGGVPDVLLEPTSRPDVPPSTPLADPYASAPGAVNGAQRRLAILQALSVSDEVSDETREWAQMLLARLAARQA